MRKQTRQLLTLVLSLAIGACAVYRPEIRQGNYVDKAKLEQVKAGMSREQVRYLLGTPMVADAWHPARWDYVFALETQSAGPGLRHAHYVVYFDGDVVREIKRID